MAARSGTNGLEIIQNGFRIKNGASYALGNCTPILNEAGTGYSYIAVR